MNQFLKYILILAIALVACMYLLEYIFTTIYYNGAPRDKVNWVKNMPKSELDYILLGSSRCKYFLQPQLIEKETGMKGLNLASVSQGPLEIKLMLQEFLKKHKTKQIFVQMDYTYNSEVPHKLGRVLWMPYLNRDNLDTTFVKYGKEYQFYNRVPFYRYLKFGPQIGIRNVTLMASGKKGTFIESRGYQVKKGVLADGLGAVSWTFRDSPNRHIEEIIKICKTAKIELCFFTSPAYQNSSDMALLEKRLPNYKDFSRSILDEQYFLQDGYLNTEGSKLFTEQFIQNYFASASKK